MHAVAIDASDQYRSPRNPERAIRRTTELVVLHTTEAPAHGSLKKLSERGECHFCVTEEGRVYRIVDRDREAFHAGRSMWNGKEDVDKFSIGVECVGYHNKPMPMEQLRAIAQLVRELKSMYHLSDAQVVAHSHVAYGAPNRWQKKRHRGRKRCGMLFSTATVRKILELKAKPTMDVDVRAGRLVVGDDYLNRVLYGGLDIMAAHYHLAPVKPTPAMPKPAPAKPMPAKSAPVRSTPARPATIVRAKSAQLTTADLVKSGYRIAGVVSGEQTALKIAGERWQSATTFYSIRDKIYSGQQINPAKLEKGTCVWLKR